MKNYRLLILLSVVILLVSSSLVFADDALKVSSFADSLEDYAYFELRSDNFIGKIYVIQDNLFYRYAFDEHLEPIDPEQVIEYYVGRIESASEKSEGKFFKNFAVAAYGADFSNSNVYLVSPQGQAGEGRKISFCDGDSVCEPCDSDSCSLSESFASCKSDCKSGSGDNFCDLYVDGICDPDCKGLDVDCSCTDCLIPVKVYSEVGCSDIGGISCGFGGFCSSGKSVFSSDDGACCVGGSCIVPGEYVESMYEMRSQPSMTITPSGILASEVEDYGIDDYCADKLNGTLCSVSETCKGDSVEYYIGNFCCKGTCVTSAVNVSNKYVDVLTGVPPEYYAAKIYGEVKSKEVPVSVPVVKQPEIVLEEKLPAEVQQETVPATPLEAISNVNLLYVALIVIGIVFIGLILMLVFNRSAGKKLEKEDIAADLQSNIDNLVSQGYDYNRIEALLISHGFDKQYVDKEINRNYANRVALESRAGK